MRMLTIAVAAALALGPTLAASGVDPRQEPPPPGVIGDDNPPPGAIGHRALNTWKSYVEIVGVRENQLNPYYLAKCGVDSQGLTCNINRTRTVTNEISAQFGASNTAVSAGIGLSSSEAIAIQVGCQSPPMKPGEEFIAIPTERHFYYVVVDDNDAFVTDGGQYISDGVWETSPVAMVAVYDEGFRCRVQRQPS